MLDGEVKVRLRTLGETLRAIRLERGLSLGEVAAGTDLSSSFLSLVENGRSDISTGRLLRVASFLKVGLGDLLDAGPPREVIVVRADERRAVEMPAEGLRMYPLANDPDRGLAMAPLLSELEAGARLDDLPAAEGVDRFVFLVSGEIEISVPGETVALAPGDCAYFQSPGAGAMRNTGSVVAVMLWVASPPR